jgi:hypothetical protein
MRAIFLLMLICMPALLQAQYAPQALVGGTAAVSKNSPQFGSWSSACTIIRGLQQIGNPASGYASVGDASAAVGAPDGSVVSLGDSGVAILRFATPIRNGAGPDFAVFENGFAKIDDPELAFLELAFVEVSSDGVNFVRFPASSQTPDTEQISSVGGLSYINARRVNNLAGKYIGSWGTPFDLAELAGTPGLDINAITHVRIVDVVGDVTSHASRDAQGKVVNDPFPTPFASGGFDLDAVGVLNAGPASVHAFTSADFSFYPNPADAVLNLRLTNRSFKNAQIIDPSGRQLAQVPLNDAYTGISLQGIPPGYYFLRLLSNDGTQCTRPFVRR